MYSIQKICVCGAGTMGSGIAQLTAFAGYPTILFDTNALVIQQGRQAIQNNLALLVAKGKIQAEQQLQCLGNIHFTSLQTDCVADLVIEAIVENAAIKKTLFEQLSLLNAPSTIFASNTSSISIAAMEAALKTKNPLIGMHFFNPAPVMKLVEVIKTANTSETVIRLITALAKKLGKTPVVCRDSPGFIVNRVARHYYLEAMKLVEEGHATIETVDAVLEATGFKMGPFKLMDLIGMDINFSVSNHVWEAMGKPLRLQPSALQKEKIEKNELGRKTGKGFYTYTNR
ncbi:MAG: hypothetical protein RLZZ28_633 [Bacteroidota bacterium]